MRVVGGGEDGGDVDAEVVGVLGHDGVQVGALDLRDDEREQLVPRSIRTVSGVFRAAESAYAAPPVDQPLVRSEAIPGRGKGGTVGKGRMIVVVVDDDDDDDRRRRR